MSLHLDERADGSAALFIDGDLQFDTRDEALYHESMALPPLCLLTKRDTIRVLICGGGDGLALRECLRFPGVIHVDLVDYDPEMLALARTRLAPYNADALADTRVQVHVQDAWEFLQKSTAQKYDVILCDFTVPRRPEDDAVFTQEWYRLLGGVLAPNGVAALNAVSPQTAPDAFWCLRKTVRAAGLSALPYRVCIPSFRAQGYGAWGFLLAAHRPLWQRDLRTLACPVPTRQADLTRLWRGAHFRRGERQTERQIPVHTLSHRCLVPLLLNPGTAGHTAEMPMSEEWENPFDLLPLLNAIPIQHPSHTRLMVETLAEHVAGSLRSLDMRRLLDALLARAARLPSTLVNELLRLREYLLSRLPPWQMPRQWGYRLFAALVITMTLANSLAPDNAFAKGSSGLGHASFSRGYSGGFAGGRGNGPTSFSGGRASTYSGTSITGGGFRSSYRPGYMTDIRGYGYPTRVYYFHSGGHYYGGGHGSGSSGTAVSPEEHQAIFVADDDMLVLDNGDVVITLSEHAYLLVSEGKVTLMGSTPDALLDINADPNLFQAIEEEIRGQQSVVQREIRTRREWLGWVGWTNALFATIQEDRAELQHLEDLDRKLTLALQRLGTPAAGAAPAPLPKDAVELFVGAFYDANGQVQLRGRDKTYYTDGKVLAEDASLTKNAVPCPPALTDALREVMAKLRKEVDADMKSNASDLASLLTDLNELNRDLAEYQSLYQQNGYDGTYEVDYGTDSIAVSDAISRTERDIAQTKQDIAETEAYQKKAPSDRERLGRAAQTFGK